MIKSQEFNSSINALWMKYCGICDEYKMLKDRWLFLNHEYEKIIPNRLFGDNDSKTMFGHIDNEIDKIDKLFKNFGGDRKLSTWLIINIDNKMSLPVYKELRDRLDGISDWVSFIKTSFYQRTVSLEISHLSFGLPRSPERTIGNELFYVAADKIAEYYLNCVNIPYLWWDGFITFTPTIRPIKGFGAMVVTSFPMRMFHIVMPDEQKYFIASCLSLAHEMAHPAIESHYFTPLIEAPYNFRVVVTTKFAEIRQALAPHIIDYVQKKISIPLFNINECKNCKIIDYALYDMNALEEVFSDLIGYYIGGNKTIENLLDEIFNLYEYLTISMGEKLDEITVIGAGSLLEFWRKLIRLYSTLHFIELTYRTEDKWIKNKFDLLELWFEKSKEVLYNSVALIKRISKKEIELSLEKRKRCMECSICFGKGIATTLQKTGIGKAIIEKCVTKNLKFSITKKEEDIIIQKLNEGKICPEYDPRKIIHCFYESFNNEDFNNRPSYATTIQSLAYNEFIKKK